MRLEMVTRIEIRIVNAKVPGLFSNETFGKRTRTLIQNSNFRSFDLGHTHTHTLGHTHTHTQCATPHGCPTCLR